MMTAPPDGLLEPTLADFLSRFTGPGRLDEAGCRTLVARLSPDEKRLLARLLQARRWSPLPGPQRAAYESEADILLYGGAAGGGKTDLLIGLAVTRHQRTVLFRREFSQTRALEDRLREVLGSGKARFNGTKRAWRLDDGRQIELGAVQHAGDERRYQGRPHDLKAFDEITHFTEAQFRFLIGWNRSTVPGLRCRVVAAGNPPGGREGDWIRRFWAPWLDPTHPEPAAPGELRWVAMAGGREIACPAAEPVIIRGERVRPRSRSFIPARVEDNPYLMATGYKTTLQALPEPLRTRMLEGNFAVTAGDDPFQVIPTAWLLAAQARWTEMCPGPMTALGVDVARGGSDRTVLTPCHGCWFGHARILPGTDTPDGRAVASLIAGMLAAGATARIDVIGVGAAVYDLVRQAGLPAEPLNGAERSTARDRSGQLGFTNRRAEWWWGLREALDPVQGEGLALPPDRELMADLAAPRWRLGAHGIQIEGKDTIRQRLGRSPDRGDALVYAHARPSSHGLLAFMANEARAFTETLS